MYVAQRADHLKGNDILIKIENTRNEMNELATIFGVTHQLTVAKSQELDLILNEYMLAPNYCN